MGKSGKVMLTLRLYPAQMAELNANYEAFLKRSAHSVSREEWARRAILTNGRTGQGDSIVLSNDDGAAGPWLPGMEPGAAAPALAAPGTKKKLPRTPAPAAARVQAAASAAPRGKVTSKAGAKRAIKAIATGKARSKAK
jgi:hypothetical protein